MTPAYALELLRIALDRTMTAAGDVYAHNPPDWLCHRLTHIIGECQSMRDALEQFAKDIEKKNNYYTWADKIVYDPQTKGETA